MVAEAGEIETDIGGEALEPEVPAGFRAMRSIVQPIVTGKVALTAPAELCMRDVTRLPSKSESFVQPLVFVA